MGYLGRKSNLKKEEEMATRLLVSILKEKQDGLEHNSVSKVFNIKA